MSLPTNTLYSLKGTKLIQNIWFGPLNCSINKVMGPVSKHPTFWDRSHFMRDRSCLYGTSTPRTHSNDKRMLNTNWRILFSNIKNIKTTLFTYKIYQQWPVITNYHIWHREYGDKEFIANIIQEHVFFWFSQILPSQPYWWLKTV